MKSSSHWVLLFLALAIFDCALTFVVLSSGGVEIMPVTQYILTKYGFSGLVCFKIVTVAIISTVDLFFKTDVFVRCATYAMVCVCALMLVSATISVFLQAHG